MEKIESSDLQLVAYALVRGARIIAINRSEPRRAVFVLQADMLPDELKQDFMSNPNVSVQDFISAQATAKKALFSDVY